MIREALSVHINVDADYTCPTTHALLFSSDCAFLASDLSCHLNRRWKQLVSFQLALAYKQLYAA